MNIDDVIRAHAAWKAKLSNYLANPDRSLNARDIGSDNKCELGRWIYGEGSRHANLPEFATLKQEHAHFHTAAACIVARVDRGELVTREVDLDPTATSSTPRALSPTSCLQ